ncbi:lytic polysaccharide monooxygenase auxiliary activity family 9 protein [Streptomyces minutiscleroticus]|uniref:Chitin-binding protein n=1 Tax=Streptomyces minutiscleroticus TaxID=68238 RepID=A0A918NUL6_9ACTN|nr:lytic polysaccharide monooxygenase [Streptomyces minutiscleroticus]GGX95497.1 chitin-binding protein [Streptomyces minutiscleroticus]
MTFAQRPAASASGGFRGRRAAVIAAVGAAPLALTGLAASPAAAHGTMGDPVSRVSQCYAEGPESPDSAACRAAVAAGGTQALYDWNGIRIGDANGMHEKLVPDGRLCSANNDAFKGLDLARTDWPATSVGSGKHTFKYRVTAPHKGTFKVYLTKAGYDPSQPLGWDDLDLDSPVATATDPAATDGFYTFSGTLPQRSGRHVLYAVWQRSDSPEAFYSCSDVTFGGASGGGAGVGSSGSGGGESGSGAGSGTTPAPVASAPTEEQIGEGAEHSTVENHGHGDDDPSTSAEPVSDTADGTGAEDKDGAGDDTATAAGNRPGPAGGAENLAETGGSSSTSYIAVGGAAALALGAAALFASVRRRAVGGGRHGR